MWIWTRRGFDRLDPVTSFISHYRHDPKEPYSLSHNFVTDILVDNTGNLWASKMGGLNRIDRHRESFVRYLAQPIV